MLLGTDRPKFWQVSFNIDSLRRLVPALVWKAWITSEYDITLQRYAFIATATRQSLLLASKHDSTLQTNMFIASDELL